MSEAPLELRLEGVAKRFGDVVALEPSDLSVEPGLLVSLLGPSGCGKTTSLRIIAGFEAPDTGRVIIGGRDMSYLPPDKRGLGMVFQNYSLFPHMTVEQNIAFGLKMAKVESAQIARRVGEMLELVQLPGFETRYPHQLSGGQQQRVALARSLITNPGVLLLDEPLGALDKNLRENMQFELRRIQQTLNITTILVTHDQEEALTLSDRVVVMNEGRILQVGEPAEVYERPRSRFVSEFLGTSNLFEGEVGAVDGAGGQGSSNTTREIDFTIRHGDGHSVLRAALSEGQTLGSNATLAVRPEKLALSVDKPADLNVLPVQIQGHVFRGSYHAYEVGLAGRDKPVFVYSQARGGNGQHVFSAGQQAYMCWDAADGIVLSG